MAEYDIHLNPRQKLVEWIEQQPNLIRIKKGIADKIYCEFNHTPEESVAFKRQIARRLSQIDIGNSTFETLINQLEELQTDQLLYTTSQSVTKTNIGLNYVDLFSDYGGRPFFVDTTGFTKLAIQILWTKVGTGTQTMQIVNHADGAVVIESPSLTTQSNEFANVAIPPAFLNFKGKWRLQVKSTTASDDPVCSAVSIYLRR